MTSIIINCVACSTRTHEDIADVSTYPNSTSNTDAKKIDEPDISNKLDSSLTEKEVASIPIEMARNNVDYGLYQIKDGWIYGAAPNMESGLLYFAKRRLENTQWTTLNECGIVDFDFKNEFIYAILLENEHTPIYKINLGGSHIEKLVSGNTEHLQVKKDKLYFCLYDENDIPYFTSCNLDGSNIQRVMDKEVYYPYTPDGNIVFYQDDKDEETIHQYNISTGEDVRISSPYAYAPIYDGGNTLYYIRNDKSVNKNDYSGDLVKRNIFTDEEITLYSGAYTGDLLLADGFLYFANCNDENRLYAINTNGENIKLISDDANTTRLIYTDERLIYTVLDDNNNVSNIYCCNLDGSNRFSLIF